MAFSSGGHLACLSISEETREASAGCAKMQPREPEGTLDSIRVRIDNQPVAI
jgi:hypothetical protein